MYDDIKDSLVQIKDYIDLILEIKEVDETNHRKAMIKVVMLVTKFCLL